jgi:hypothetical protein
MYSRVPVPAGFSSGRPPKRCCGRPVPVLMMRLAPPPLPASDVA